MAIFAPNPEKSNFVPCPAGWQQVVCVDVVDMGMQPGYQGGPQQHKIRLVFQSQFCDEGGRSFATIKNYTLSLHDKSGLLRDLQGWFGRSIPMDERKALDLETLVGMNAMALISHEPTADGGVFAKVQVLAPMQPNQQAMSAKDYTRVKDRPGAITGTTPAERQAQQPAPQAQPQPVPLAAPAPVPQPVAQPAPVAPVTIPAAPYVLQEALAMPWDPQQPAAAPAPVQPAETVDQLRLRLRGRLQTLSAKIPGAQLIGALQEATGVGSLDAANHQGLLALDVRLNAFEAPAAGSHW